MAFFAFCFGYAFAFYWAWQYTLILFAGFPIIMGALIGFGKGLEKGVLEQMRGYA